MRPRIGVSMFYAPYPQQTNPIEDIKRTMEFVKEWEKAIQDKEKEGKKPKPKKPADIFTTIMFFTVFTPFVMLAYGYFMLNMLLSVLEGIAKIKGLH